MRLILFMLPALLAACSPSDNMTVHAFRLLPGQDLKQEIQRYAEEHQIEAGFVQTCVGSLTDWQLRFANQPTRAGGSGHFEIVSLVGTVSVHGSHLHASLSDSTGRVVGGHLLDGNLVYTTAEIVIGESPGHVFRRAKDGTTPYEELQVETR